MDANSLFQRAVDLSDSGEQRQAIDLLSAAIRLDSQNPQYFNSRGISWALLREYDRAIADYSEAIRLDRQYAKAFKNRGVTRCDAGQLEESLTDLDEAIRLMATYAGAYNARGIVWSKKGDYERALSDYRIAIRLDPEPATSYRQKGAFWLKEDQDQAIAEFTKALELDPSDSDCWTSRGICWFLKGEYDRALHDYNRALSLNMDSGMAYHNRGIVFSLLEQASEAASDFTEAIRRLPSPALSHLGRSKALTMMNDRDAGVIDLAIAVWIDPKLNEAFEILADHCAMNAVVSAISGDFEKAAREQLIAVGLSNAKNEFHQHWLEEYYLAGKLPPIPAPGILGRVETNPRNEGKLERPERFEPVAMRYAELAANSEASGDIKQAVQSQLIAVGLTHAEKDKYQKCLGKYLASGNFIRQLEKDGSPEMP